MEGKEEKKTAKKKKVKYEPIVKERIREFLTIKEISHKQCCEKAGITRGIMGQESAIGEENLVKFLRAYPEVNVYWVLFGEGKMLNEADSKVEDDNNREDEDEMKMAADPSSSSYEKDNLPYKKLFREKDAQVGALLLKVGALEERIRHLEGGNSCRKE